MVTAHFNNIRQNILNCLDEATSEILVAVYWFTNHELFDKLCERKQAGLIVELIVHNDFINNRETGLNFQKFIDLGGEFYFSDSDNPMHNKFCVVDNKTLINGSYNWTYFAENKNSENILTIKEEQQTVSAFRDEFANLKEQLTKVDKVVKLTKFEVDEFNGLSARDYLANDIVYEAKATNRPEIIEAAFQIAPSNIKVQQIAVSLNLSKKRKLKYSLGASVLGDKYLKIVEKGTIIPVTMTSIVVTVEDNQVSAGSTIYFGENERASKNKAITEMTLNGIPKMPAGQAKMKYIFTIDIYGKLNMTKYSLDNGRRVTSTANLINLIEDE